MTDPVVCAKCKQPCDETCAVCKKGYTLHLRCMKPGDRLTIRLRQWNWPFDLAVVSSVIGLGLMLAGMAVLLCSIEPLTWFGQHVQETVAIGVIMILPGILLLFRTVR